MIQLQVNEHAADYILKMLAQRPFAEVAELMNDLVQQVQRQQHVQAQAQQAQVKSVASVRELS